MRRRNSFYFGRLDIYSAYCAFAGHDRGSRVLNPVAKQLEAIR
jgi:hypothetical protein